MFSYRQQLQKEWNAFLAKMWPVAYADLSDIAQAVTSSVVATADNKSKIQNGLYLNDLELHTSLMTPKLSLIQIIQSLRSVENSVGEIGLSVSFKRLMDQYVLFYMEGWPFERFIVNAECLRMEAFRQLGMNEITLKRFYNNGKYQKYDTFNMNR